MISMIVPTAGLFRHNEILWQRVGELKGLDVELVVATSCGGSSRLNWALEKAHIRALRMVDVGDRWTMGRALVAGASVASGEHLAFWHDDADIENLADTLMAIASDDGMGVPIVEKSTNPDQLPGGEGVTTRYVDRCVFGLRRDLYERIGGIDPAYEVDGYQLSVQHRLARLGMPAIVKRTPRVRHTGGSTLLDVIGMDGYAGAYRRDMERLAEEMDVPLELNCRPGMPRIIPTGRTVPDGVSVPLDEAIDGYDADHWEFRGKAYGRIRLGHRFSIAPLMDTYDIALVRTMGIGDAMMLSASIGEFKRRFPHVMIRVFASGLAEDVMRRCPAVDQVEHVLDWRQVPSSAVDWSIGNGREGTPAFGFHALRIDDTPPPWPMCFAPRLVDVPRVHGPAMGIQLHGGWPTKRYGRWQDLARTYRAAGWNVLLFHNRDVEQIPDDLAKCSMLGKTPTIDHLAAVQRQLNLWIGFDSGASFMANALGVPSVWLFASHDPSGLIGLCGATAPWTAIWRGWPMECLLRHETSCRFEHMGDTCPLRSGPGADCIDDIDVQEIVAACGRVLEASNVA